MIHGGGVRYESLGVGLRFRKDFGDVHDADGFALAADEAVEVH